ncbi:FAD-binding oxidoreductase [Prauserella sp. ASG 168]|uniref:FAD-binding oxidoreductase n=1 Tax=Prauserella cavernicola TaxID=2800127 RepID=A0A934QYQ3_9PSEU|nr:FAD-binding oxidoreductase [Prauserella cavernicola]
MATRALPSPAGRRVLDRWSGERPCGPDGMPAIGGTKRCANLSVAVGHGRWGADPRTRDRPAHRRSAPAPGRFGHRVRAARPGPVHPAMDRSPARTMRHS